jgi:DNA ligase-1
MLDVFANYLTEAHAVTGKKAKVELTRRYLTSHPGLAELFKLALSPYITFGVAKLPPVVAHDDMQHFPKWQVLLDRLASRELTGNAALEQIGRLLFALYDLPEAHAFQAILLKDLACGVGIETVNAARPGTVPQFAVQLAVSEMPKLADIVYPVLVEPKYDGVRCVTLKQDGKVQLFSRNGQPFENFAELEEALRDTIPSDFMLDGEVVSPAGFQTLMTRVKAKPGKRTDVPIEYRVFDAMPAEQFLRQDCSLTLSERQRYSPMEWLTSDIIQRAPSQLARDAEDLEEIYHGWLQLGLEGVMLKSPDGLYTFKRNKTWRKLKPFDSADLKILGMIEGVGKFAGSLGAMLVEGTLEDGRFVKSEVGSFRCSDEERLRLWQRRDELIGMIAEIRYQEVTADNSLRFTSYLRLREDKTA